MNTNLPIRKRLISVFSTMAVAGCEMLAQAGPSSTLCSVL